MYLREHGLEEAVELAIRNRLGVEVRKVKLAYGVDEYGDAVIFVTVNFVARPKKRGFMFDLVAAANDALRKKGVFTPAIVTARSPLQEGAGAH